MRRALGLDRETPLVFQPTHSPNPSNGLHQRRQFVRDGDAPVSVVHSDGGSRLQNWTPPDKPFGSRPLRARKSSGCWRTRATRSTTLRQNLAMSVLRRTSDAASRCRAAEGRGSTHWSSGRVGSRAALRARAERERDEAAVVRQTAEQRLRQRTAVKAALPPSAQLPTDHGRPDVVVGLRRSPGRMLRQTVRRSWNGGRRGGRRNTGSVSLMQPHCTGRTSRDQAFPVKGTHLTLLLSNIRRVSAAPALSGR